MNRLQIARRISPISQPIPVDLSDEAWRFLPVQTNDLREEEFRWSATLILAYQTLKTPPSLVDVTLGSPSIVDETPVILAPRTQAFEIAFEDTCTVDLFQDLNRPQVDGTIYIKRQQELFEQGHARTKITVEPHNFGKQRGSKEPRGLNVFELFLPILLPPASTEFADELLFPKDLYPFQRAGVKWLFDHENALLADDMGLGKTVQTITAFRALMRRSKALHALIICPKSVLPTWIRELEKWAPELIELAVQGSADIRRVLWRTHIGKCHVLLTTYDLIRQDRDHIGDSPLDLVVCDEVQRIKNPETQAAQAVRGISAARRWALTGTPIENNLDDLVAIFRFVLPGLLPAKASLVMRAQEIREAVRPHVLRRRKEDALPELPEKVIDTKWLELSDAQRRAYDQAERRGKQELLTNENVTLQHVLSLIQKLKQICNFDAESRESTKIDFLVEDYLPEACINDQKALIISQYVQTLERIQESLISFNPLLYTGKLSTAQREKIHSDFTSKDAHKVLLLSLRAGGVGINLTRANYVVHFDRWWNPAVERQAEDRTHRIGQERSVFVTRLICKDTIEERIEKILERKRILFREVIDELADVDLEGILSEEELFGLFALQSPRSRTQSQDSHNRSLGSKGIPKPSQSDVRDETTATVIRPEEPFSNLVRLRTILRDSEEYICWADLHFSARALEEIIVTLDPASVRSVRILSGPANVNERAKKDFERFREELAKKSVVAEWRMLQEFAHDRFIITKKACFNVPPINSLLKGSYSEILKTPNRPPFDRWWELANPITESEHLENKPGSARKPS